MKYNSHIDQLPKHLKQYIVNQKYEHYTPMDHAIWRFVMRQNRNYLKDVAHESYLDGLRKTGIETDHIANMYGMNRILKDIGWAAAAVDGFIPPAAFMEFQAHKVLVIAEDIRTIDHLGYTPAPDIIHEAAGHAPIIAVPEYSDYLVRFGELGSKALSSKKDYQLYEAIRHLSIIKEDPSTSLTEIKEGEERIAAIQASMGEPSEMALIRNLHWWTVEYGLIGTLDEPRIYGAGLLSSINESMNCLKSNVKKLPYSLDAAYYNFDITNQQPQLFVTPSFEYLNEVLEEFSNSMAFKKGGLKSLQKAIESEGLATCQFDTGLQISGIFSDVIFEDEKIVYISMKPKASIAFNNKELEGFGKKYFKSGLSVPVGLIREFNYYVGKLKIQDLSLSGITKGKKQKFHYNTGLSVDGIIREIVCDTDYVQLIILEECEVIYNNRFLHKKNDGVYILPIVGTLTSVYSGVADVEAYNPTFLVPKEKTHKIEYDDKTLHLHGLYAKVRQYREEADPAKLLRIWEDVKTNYSYDWLLSMEILEIISTSQLYKAMEMDILNSLKVKMESDTNLKANIQRGLNLIYPNFV